MNIILLLTTLATLAYNFVAENASINSKITYEILFKAGVDAYLENRWSDCVGLIEKSIEDYFYFRSVTVRCRKECSERDFISFFNASITDSNLWRLQNLVTNKALCLLKCKNVYFPDRPQVSKETDLDFEKKVPYNYLQLCYYKINEPTKAASCAYTFLLHNPGHEVMTTNLQYYVNLPEVNVSEIKYLEPKDYQELFLRGAQLYSEGKYKESREVMEASILEYLIAEDECRYLCEGSRSETSNEELFVSITDHLTFSLRCKLRCPLKLSYIYGQLHDDLFSSHYHYLQFNYHKLKLYKETCEAVASYLLFHQNDKTMLSNKDFYAKQSGISKDWFVPRKEAVKYYERYQRESKFLKAIEDSFKFSDSELFAQSLTPPPGSPLKSEYKRRSGKKRKSLPASERRKWLMEADVKEVLGETDLKGKQRVLLTNLASDEECNMLVNLAVDGGVHGDGYNGKESPHTEFEMFEGLTVARAATLSQRGLLNPLGAQLFMNISEKARQAVEVYFDLDTELYFAYTHLVCRTALPDSSNSRVDLSHPIHADNCVLTPQGKCLKEKPAYVWRDYSSIIYLNEDFEGGEFIFARSKDEIEATIKPKCGHMVAFSAGKENLHGVKAVQKGRRCALAMWYTLDANHREKERDFASSVLQNIRSKQILSAYEATSESFEKSTLLKYIGKVEKTSHEHSEL